MYQDQRDGGERGADPAVHGRSGDAQRLTARGRGQPRQRSPGAFGQELDQERSTEDEIACSPGDGNDEERGEEKAEESGYFRLTHFTRRHPLKRLTWLTSSGLRPTWASSGLIWRLDFQPSRVLTGATISSIQPGIRRSLRK